MNQVQLKTTKKQHVLEMICSRPTSLAEICKELSISDQAARSLVNDLRMMDIQVTSMKTGDQLFYSSTGRKQKQTLKRDDRFRAKPQAMATYEKLLVETLKEHGGSGFIRDLRQSMTEKLNLSEGELAVAPNSYYPRWWVRVVRARQSLVRDGLMKKDSPQGYWELADQQH